MELTSPFCLITDLMCLKVLYETEAKEASFFFSIAEEVR
jgi:hypothetical protein